MQQKINNTVICLRMGKKPPLLSHAHPSNKNLFYIRASPLDVPNAKYLAFSITNTKKSLIGGTLNIKRFDMDKQYSSKYTTVRIDMIKLF